MQDLTPRICSADEEYLACLLECVVVGEADPSRLRPKIARILSGSASLLARFQQARSDDGGTPTWAVDTDRAKNVVLKLARCHAAFESNEPQLEEPDFVSIKPLALMTNEEHAAFEGQDGGLAFWPEVGSRAMQRLLVFTHIKGARVMFSWGMALRTRRPTALDPLT